MNKEAKTLVGIALVVLIAAAVFVFVSSNKTNQTSDNVWRSDAPVKGRSDAKVQLVEFGDFQCPTCQAMAPILDDLLRKIPTAFMLQYRYLPLPEHGNAYVAALAAESVNRQGKFWDFHDFLYQNQSIWADSTMPKDIFNNDAIILGLDMNKYTSDLSSASVKKTVDSDLQTAADLGLNGTPSFFINNVQYTGKLTENDLESAILKVTQ